MDHPSTGYFLRDHDKTARQGGGHGFRARGLGYALGQRGRNTIAASEWFQRAVEATPLKARQLRARFEQWLQTLDVPAALVDDLTLAVYEALANVAEHAYPPDHPHPLMRLHAQVEHCQVLITVSDHGHWRTPPPDPGYRGRGLAMMRSLSTELHLHPTPEGTIVELRAPLHRSGRCTQRTSHT